MSAALAYQADSSLAESFVARGDEFDDEGLQLRSPLPNVSDDRWTQFVHCMATMPCGAVSRSNALGMFELTPRRLADLGVVAKLARSQSPDGHTVWVAIFVPPLTSVGFLKSPQAQYDVFSRSMRDYADKMAGHEIERDEGMSLSGALAILHRCGPGGLGTWRRGDRFPSTIAAYDRVAGVF